MNNNFLNYGYNFSCKSCRLAGISAMLTFAERGGTLTLGFFLLYHFILLTSSSLRYNFLYHLKVIFAVLKTIKYFIREFFPRTFKTANLGVNIIDPGRKFLTILRIICGSRSVLKTEWIKFELSILKKCSIALVA